MREVTELLKLQTLSIDHVTIQSEINNLIRAKVVRCEWHVFGGITSPIAMVRNFLLQNPLRWSGPDFNADPELMQEFGTVPNTTLLSSRT